MKKYDGVDDWGPFFSEQKLENSDEKNRNETSWNLFLTF